MFYRGFAQALNNGNFRLSMLERFDAICIVYSNHIHNPFLMSTRNKSCFVYIPSMLNLRMAFSSASFYWNQRFTFTLFPTIAIQTEENVKKIVF